jgi:hypothetical protein
VSFPVLAVWQYDVILDSVKHQGMTCINTGGSMLQNDPSQRELSSAK